MISTAYAASGGDHAMAFYQDPTFWVMIALFAFFALLGKTLFKAVGGALDNRAAQIKEHLEDAARLREEAQELLASYKRKQQEAEKEAESIVQRAKDEAERIEKKSKESLEASLKRREAAASDRIAQAEKQAVAEVQALATDVAMSAAKTILEEGVSAQKANAMIDTAIKDLPGKLSSKAVH